MKQFKWDFWATLGVVVSAFCGILVFGSGCDKQQLEQVRDVSDTRRVLCSAADAYRVEKAQRVCAAGASLEEVAAAFAGCEAATVAPAASASASVVLELPQEQ